MVRQVSSTQIEANEKRKETTTAIRSAFYSSTTLRHLDFEKLPDSYVPAVIYAFLVNVSVFLVKLGAMLKEFGFQGFKIEFNLIGTFFLNLAIILFGSFLTSSIGGYIVEHKKAPKYYMLIVSSLTYSCVIAFFALFFPSIANFIAYGFDILNFFYLWMSLLQATEYSEKRLFVIHLICNLVMHFVILHLTIYYWVF